ncbi:hypothetical protein RJ640_002918, partial [Escallonia rubra]
MVVIAAVARDESRREVVAKHLVLRGIVKGYDRWIYHGEDFGSYSHKYDDDGAGNISNVGDNDFIPEMIGDVAT